MNGPYESDQQLREAPAVRAAYDAFDRDHGPGKMAPHCEQILEVALSAAGVETGAYDRRIIAWLASWGPETCAVVAGLIGRAYQAPARPVTVRLSPAELVLIFGALTDARNTLDPEGGHDCADCHASETGQCPRHRDDRLTAAEIHSLHARLAGA